MGKSKGLTYDRVLIYPTADMLKWIENHSMQLASKTKSKFYVALTRARYSVAVICKNNTLFEQELTDIQKWHQ